MGEATVSFLGIFVSFSHRHLSWQELVLDSTFLLSRDFLCPPVGFSGSRRTSLQGGTPQSREITLAFHAGWQMSNEGFSAFLQNSPSAVCCLEAFCFFPFYIELLQIAENFIRTPIR